MNISCQKDDLNADIISNTDISGEWRFALFISHNKDLTATYKDNTILFLAGNVAEFRFNKGFLIQKGTWIASSNPTDDDDDFEDQTYYFQVEYSDNHSGGIFRIILEESIITNSFIIGSNKEEGIQLKLEKL